MKLIARGAAAAIAVLTIAACGGGGDDTGEAATTTAPPTTVAIIDTPVVTTATPSPSSTSVAPASGSIRVGVATDLQTLDPHRAQPAQLHYLKLAYDGLTSVGADGRVQTLLASEITSDDLVTWTVKLAEGARFADGTPVDSKAVVYSLERGRKITESPSAPAFAQITSVEAVDDATVKIVLAGPNVAFPRDMAGLAGLIVNPASDGTDLTRVPAGAGPYTFNRSGSKEGSEYRYEVRTDYWGAGVGVAEISLVLMADPIARVNAIQSGQIDIAAELGPADQARLSGFELAIAPTSEPLFIYVVDSDGTKVKALGDPRVRQAMALAIDREAVFKAVFAGGGIPTTAFWTKGSPYYSDEVDAVGFDLAKAKALLTEAGFPDGFEFSTPTVEALRLVTEAVAASLSQVGIKMKIELQQPGTLGQQVRDGKWAANLTIARGITAQSFYNERFPADAPFNPFKADRSPVVKLGEAAQAAKTDTDANALWADAYAEAVKQGYVVVVGHVTTGAAIGKGVTGAAIPAGSLVPDLRFVRVGS